jgi:hypothetical protein
VFRKRILLEYADQNDEFGAFFPRKAKIVKKLKSSDSGKDWLLIELEEPFVYGKPNEFGNHMLTNTHLLITARLQGGKVSDSKFHAHVVLVPELPDLEQELVTIDQSNHVAWCVAKKCT